MKHPLSKLWPLFLMLSWSHGSPAETPAFAAAQRLGAPTCLNVGYVNQFPTTGLAPDYQFELRDSLHRHGFYLNQQFAEYKRSQKQAHKASLRAGDSHAAFFYWLSNRADIPRVKYFNEQERLASLLEFHPNNILVFAQTGQKIKNQMLMYVMDECGNFYAHAKQKASDASPVGIHHSSFFAGGPVAGSGYLQFDSDGRLIAVDNFSGHYKPTDVEMMNVFEALIAHGVQLQYLRFERRIEPIKIDKEIFNAYDWYEKQLAHRQKAKWWFSDTVGPAPR